MPDSDSREPGCTGDDPIWNLLPDFQSYALQQTNKENSYEEQLKRMAAPGTCCPAFSQAPFPQSRLQQRRLSKADSRKGDFGVRSDGVRVVCLSTSDV